MKRCEVTGKGDPCSSQIENLKKTLEKIPVHEELENISEVFKAISDPTRIKILYLLHDGELCGCEINMALEKPQSTISHHLNVLKTAGFIKGRKDGLWIHYKLSNPSIIESIEKILEII